MAVEDKCSVFAVRLNSDKGHVKVRAQEHFCAEDICAARASVGLDVVDSFSRLESPLYLVHDEIVKIALRSSQKSESSHDSECHAGINGSPCGECPICSENREDCIAEIVLGRIELPDTELSHRVRNAIASVIGMTWIDVPWSNGISDDEIKDAMDEIGTKSSEIEKQEGEKQK